MPSAIIVYEVEYGTLIYLLVKYIMESTVNAYEYDLT